MYSTRVEETNVDDRCFPMVDCNVALDSLAPFLLVCFLTYQKFCLLLLVAEEKELFMASYSKLEQLSLGLDRFFQRVWTAHPHLYKRKERWQDGRVSTHNTPPRASSSNLASCVYASWTACVLIAMAIFLDAKSSSKGFPPSFFETAE
mmetsp:Transcript_2173/g.14381  ORF Transcript_2173/g.14381 Transcript_2173/m.14381 type:complete len:148 (+) Transcript_2173:1742-2185(+)